MAGQSENIDVEEEQLEEVEEDAEDKLEDETETRYEVNDNLADAYGSPAPEEKDNQWSVIRNAIERQDNTKTTFLTESELGRPVFSVRFYLDMEDLAKHYGADLIADYFKNKIDNITSSGMSNKGFTMNLAVTRKHDATRRRVRPFNSDAVKGGDE